MDVCVVGAGVIGPIFGQVLHESGRRVTKRVRPGGGARLAKGLDIDLLDGRSAAPAARTVVYRPTVVERFGATHPFDLILASVQHYQLVPTVDAYARRASW